MRVFLLFSVFFILTSAVLWFEERRNDMIAPYSRNTLYDAGFYAVAVVSIECALGPKSTKIRF